MPVARVWVRKAPLRKALGDRNPPWLASCPFLGQLHGRWAVMPSCFNSGWCLTFCSLFRKLLAQARERGVADLSTDRDYNQLADRVNKTPSNPSAVSYLSIKTSTKRPNFVIQK